MVTLVWDAVASTSGVFLNSMLMKGPNLLCSLLYILFGFQERLLAIAGDIAEMYHQVAIIREDLDSQRILWKDKLFVASCSPTAAHYVKNLNANNSQDESSYVQLKLYAVITT